MNPGLFIGIAHNVRNGFSYELLEVASHWDIPTYGCLYTVIFSVVRKKNIPDTDAPIICEEEGVRLVTNRLGDPIGEYCSTSSEELHSNIEV